jgi:hypothetical protein
MTNDALKFLSGVDHNNTQTDDDQCCVKTTLSTVMDFNGDKRFYLKRYVLEVKSSLSKAIGTT